MIKNLLRKKEVSVERKKGADQLASLKKILALISGRGKFSLKAQTAFAKRLAFLIDAGVPLAEAITMLYEQARHEAEQKMLRHILDDVVNGQALSKSFAKHPAFFGNFAIHVVQVGESSGTLSQSLVYLSDELRKRQALKQKLIGAFIYPALLGAASIGIIVFLMVYLFPKIMPIFASLNTTLPWTTQTVIGVSSFLQNWGWVVLIAIGIFTFLITFALKKSARLRYLRDRFVLSLPVVGEVIRNYNIANSTRTLGLLLRSGMRLSEALPVTAETSRNLVYKALFLELREAVLRGERISTTILARPMYFPDMLSHMVAVGERSGALSDTLVYLSDLYDGEVDEFTKNISTLVEPVLMIVMGIIVGFIAISIITPIYGITENLRG